MITLYMARMLIPLLPAGHAGPLVYLGGQLRGAAQLQGRRGDCKVEQQQQMEARRRTMHGPWLPGTKSPVPIDVRPPRERQRVKALPRGAACVHRQLGLCDRQEKAGRPAAPIPCVVGSIHLRCQGTYRAALGLPLARGES